MTRKVLLARAADSRWASVRPNAVDFLPVLQVEALQPTIPTAKYQAVVLTSANAARPDLLQPFVDLPVYAVGDVTAHMARQAGCRKVASAKGTVQDLVALLTATLNPHDGAILYLRAQDVTLDLAAVLGQATFAVNDAVVYRTTTLEVLPAEIADGLKQRTYDVVATFSPKGAQTLEALLTGCDLTQTTLTGISPACTEPLKDAGWRGVSPSPTPTFQGLYDHIKTL